MTKRMIDVALAALILFLTSPLMALAALMIWVEDRRTPLYRSERVGLDGRTFAMLKLRSMVVGADTSGSTSTSNSDPRVTRIGRTLRRLKIDELPQFWNVVRGDMSVVGPRPNVATMVALYTAEERRLLSVRPGVTDLASIVFADEGEILDGESDPDLAYNQLIRPWKSQLGLHYVDNKSIRLDVVVVLLTLVSLIHRRLALRAVARFVCRDDHGTLRLIVLRLVPLVPVPPPGADSPTRTWRSPTASA